MNKRILRELELLENKGFKNFFVKTKKQEFVYGNMPNIESIDVGVIAEKNQYVIYYDNGKGF